MTPEPDFLIVEDVLLIHEEQLARYGGSAGLREPTMLESAVAQPQATFGGEFLHIDLFAMAAAYAFHIAKTSRSSTATSARGWLPHSRFSN